MSESITSCVRAIVDRSPFITEALRMDIASFSRLSRFIKDRVEAMYGKSVSETAIMMALSRYADKIRKEPVKRANLEYEIVMRTNIYDVNFRTDTSDRGKLLSLYDLVHPDEGDFLSLSIGSYETSLAISGRYKEFVDEIIFGRRLLHSYDDLVALTIVFRGEFVQTPGITYLAARKLAWEDVNIIEVISTMSELTFVVSKNDSKKAYDALGSFLSEEL